MLTAYMQVYFKVYQTEISLTERAVNFSAVHYDYGIELFNSTL